MKLVDGDGNEVTLYPTDYLQITTSDGNRWLIASVTADGDLMLHTPPLEYRWLDSSPHHPGLACESPCLSVTPTAPR